MKKWMFRIIWAPALVLAVLFLVANRQPVAVSLDPFSAAAPSLTTPALPLWLWLMAMLFAGFGAGAFGMWMSGRSNRLQARAARKEIKSLRQEISALSQRLEATDDKDMAKKQEFPALSVADAEPDLVEDNDAAVKP